MCNKVDNSVQIFGCIKAVKALIAIAISWALLGLLILIFCIVVFTQAGDEIDAIAKNQTNPEKQKFAKEAAEETRTFGLSLGIALSTIPFSNAICLGILICAECVFLYAIVGLIGILSLAGNIYYLVDICLKAAKTGKPAGEAIMDNLAMMIGGVLGVFITFVTIYAMFALACCGEKRSAGSGETCEEDEYEIEEGDTTTTTTTTFMEE